ncbi:cell elongation-specific peptidoglycan biosynthesis regulator RodA [Syntrophobotulus glycolicus DSM 8271]|uniref:Cell elongation-specific peptidoglycan biosynthesis regulator RodA n=1 Tax=Syntrophobotulus glycolicus (strain DSM 8271 / FlGlyR) TaxID=645991 RepID=F0SUQ8_SYNGF|nr:FtsW/RodA/SpoVE family cell cycle protein [Syntrophobotulus glycolicus]ADY56624.1 cell elongation-specific peptidoglycan biosynthesis regulator RodA [Syntrophobotulus glycolicus DSM 8271]
MRNSIIFRFLTLLILWVGLGVLKLNGNAVPENIWQAVVFSLLVLLGLILELTRKSREDFLILPVVQTILVIGLVFLVRIDPELAGAQFFWANLGHITYYFILFGIKDYSKLGQYQYLWGLLALILLLVTLVFGFSINGSTSWIKIGGIGLEPEELVKVTLLLFLAGYLDQKKELLSIGTVQFGRLSLPDKKAIGPFAMLSFLVLALLAAQKSLGTAMVFFFFILLMIYMVTERKIYLIMSLPLIALTGTAGYFLFSHVRLRFSVWLNPWLSSSGGGYQISQSLFAISGGYVTGTGLGNGIGAFQIPASSTDFIFSVIAEETGFMGAMALISLYIIVVMRAFTVSMRAPDRFGRILAGGIGIIIAIESLIILAGVTKLLPLTGIPLPWVSYGGSSMLVHFLLLGILANISRHTGRRIADAAKGKQVKAI